jgi:N-formylglutamate amidohydrolase
MNLVEITRGDSPLVLGLPHTGTEVPDDCLARLNDTGPRPGRYRLAYRPALCRAG